jgi:MerR family mercuric resistance operon transcriptional regulator
MSLRIGDVAERAGVNLQTIRYYEREGLLPPPRLASGYRVFSDSAVRQVRFIKRAQELGFSLAEIRDLLSLRASAGAGAQDMRRRARAKIIDIEDKIRSLQAMKEALATLAERCPGCGPLSDCPILDALDEQGADL